MPITPNELKAYATRYNRLTPDVEAVYERLASRTDRLKLIRNGLKIIHKHGAEKYLGFFLLHRHFSCPTGSVFVERRYTPTKGHAQVLVTTAESVATAPRRAAPHRFTLGKKGTLDPVEFTTDTSVALASKKLSASRGLVSDMAAYLVGENAADILGLGIYVRTGTVAKATSVFLEESHFPTRSSIVHVLPKLPHELGRTIPTLWTYGERGNGCCSQQCVAYCHHPSTPGLGYCGHRKSGHIGCV
jgi:hypothetical protein